MVRSGFRILKQKSEVFKEIVSNLLTIR